MRRKFFRWFWLPIYRVYALRHIGRSRTWRWGDLRLEVPSGVFHPGIFFSTPILLDFLQSIDFQNKKTLDVGTGSGAIALAAARRGADSWAVDISPLAAATARHNALANGCRVQVLESDLFAALPPDFRADVVLANPPYYPRTARTDAERAFFAGENLEYFDRFFEGVGAILRPDGQVWMILSEDCDWRRIESAAQQHDYVARVLHEHRHWGERLFVAEFSIG
jgi:release factor glutamine methyltransferase